MFRCAQDPDIEAFLQGRAKQFSDRGWCAVYLLLDEASFHAGKLKIEAYFTLSHKSMIADPEQMSRGKIAHYGGFKTAKTLDFVLIGQLGKYIDGSVRSHISGAEILEEAFGVIRQATDLIPCKYAMIECGDSPKLRKFYEDNGFAFFQKDGLNQYTKRI